MKKILDKKRKDPAEKLDAEKLDAIRNPLKETRRKQKENSYHTSPTAGTGPIKTWSG